MAILIFVFYLVVFCGIFYFSAIRLQTGLATPVLLGLFLLKVAAGCINLYFHEVEYISNDIWFYYTQSMNDLKGFSSDPGGFFREWLLNWGELKGQYNVFSPANMPFWTNLGALLHSKFMTLANICTRGHLYADVIFFNAVYFIGQLHLYKAFYRLQPEKKWLFLFVIFLVPSVLFWCSGIHKDGWILAGIGFSAWYGVRWLDDRKAVYLPAILLSLFLLLITRYFVLLCFLPLFLAWMVLNRHPRRLAWLGFSLLLLLVLFFTLGQFTGIEPMAIITAKQQAFFRLIGYSDMKTPVLENNLASFVRNFPVALEHILLRPAFAFAASFKYQVAALDAWLVLGCIVLSVWHFRRANAQQLMYTTFLLFAILMYLFIGYTIPNCGALVRYKSECTSVMLASLVALSEWPFKRWWRAGDTGV